MAMTGRIRLRSPGLLQVKIRHQRADRLGNGCILAVKLDFKAPEMPGLAEIICQHPVFGVIRVLYLYAAGALG